MKGQGGILALDLSGRAGWCYGLPGADPMMGVWVLPPYAVHEGRCLAALENEVLDMFTVHDPDEVWIEAPLPAGAQTHALSAQQQFELTGQVKGACYRWEKPVRLAHANTVRKAVMGRGRNVEKADVMAWCRGQGWEPTDHNAGDAAVLWRYACMQRASRRAA